MTTEGGSRRGWRETIEPGLYRAHRLACPSSDDHRTGRRCRCPSQVKAPGARPGATRMVTVAGSVGEARAERRRFLAAGRPEPATIQAHEKRYRLRITTALGRLNAADIDRATCEVYLAELVAAASSRQMVEKTIKALRAIRKAGVEWGWMASNPAAEVRLPRPDALANAAVTRVLTAGQLADLFAAAAPNPRVPSMLRMAGEAGLRRGEVIGLRRPDLDPAARRVSVERAVWQERTRGPSGEPGRKIVKGPKGGRSRRVAMSDGIVEALRPLVRAVGRPGPAPAAARAATVAGWIPAAAAPGEGSGVLRLLADDGCEQVAQVGSHRQLKHPTKPGRVTVAGNRNHDLAPKTLAGILEQAKLRRTT